MLSSGRSPRRAVFRSPTREREPMPTVHVNGIDLHHELRGSGPPLLLIPGLASDVATWVPVRDALGARFSLIAVDNRGCGRTTPANAPITVEQMADDCAALLDALGIGRAHVLGHSMGGMIALELAARHPDRVDRLVLAGTGRSSRPGIAALKELGRLRPIESVAKTQWFRLLFPWLFRPAFFSSEATVAAAAEIAASYRWLQSDEGFARQLAAATSYAGFDAAAARVTARTLHLHGAKDLLMPFASAGRAFDPIPSLRRVVLDDAAHALYWDQPEEFTREAIAFLETD
jgi:pimeloyl-ACP methyl ester carboxylesterase